MKFKTFPIFLAFLVMGIADAMGPMASAVEKNYELSAVVATLLTFFVFIAFAVFSVPGGVLAARIGKKNLLLLGLGLNIIAMAIPTFINPGFTLLLFCIFLLGIGTTFLQVAGNPIMYDVSEKGTYSRNLALAQGIKGLGASGSAYLVGLVLVLPIFATMGWRGVFPVFLLFMVLAFVFVALLKVEETKADIPPSIGSSLKLLKEPVFALAVVGIFLYVGAEVCMGRFLKPTLESFGFSTDNAALWGPTVFFGTITFGRLVAGSINLNAHTFFRISASLGLLGVVFILTGQEYLTLAGIVLGGLGFANIWPMLFSITIEEKPERSSELSGLMVMAISGGALVPLVMGELVDSGMLTLAYIVPAICFGYLFLLSLKGKKKIAAA
ncbi:MAG: MFS transporter [Ignavibacteriae bacterium]|nr:MFS transporter [Ignavibacteriota bacterium]MCB9208890.1 MFS transporter [Ignavibacteriales bacterium]MCB9218192.1 MFS transporter [Ignavibacteriales bacterium]MCB9260693.1 MFS transporter [Ignavibacteriales bacterium]